MKNWKSTVLGLLVAVGNVSVNGLTLKQFAISAAIAALGAWAKDRNNA